MHVVTIYSDSLDTKPTHTILDSEEEAVEYVSNHLEKLEEELGEDFCRDIEASLCDITPISERSLPQGGYRLSGMVNGKYCKKLHFLWEEEDEDEVDSFAKELAEKEAKESFVEEFFK